MALDLTLQSTQDFILERIQEAVKYDDQEAAGEVLKIFREEMPKQLDKVEADPDLYDSYRKSWIIAQFIRLSSIPDDDFFDLLKEHLVDGLQIEEYDIIEKIGLRISFILTEEEQVAFMEQLMDIIKKNTGVLGAGNLKLSGRTVLPTIANWILDYDNYPSQSAQKSDYEQIAYVSKSPNTANLSVKEKEILLDVLDCYDSLRNLLAYYKKLPVVEGDEIKPEDLYLYYPGAIFVDEIEGEGNVSTNQNITNTTANSKAIPKPIPPVIPKIETPIYNAPAQPKLEPAQPDYVAQKEEPKIEKSKSVAEEVKEAVEKNEYKAPPRPLLNIQDFLNERHNKNDSRGGLVFDGPTETSAPTTQKSISSNTSTAPKSDINSSTTVPTILKAPENLPVKTELSKTTTVRPPTLPKQPNKQEEIAKKLEELRKRKKS